MVLGCGGKRYGKRCRGLGRGVRIVWGQCKECGKRCKEVCWGVGLDEIRCGGGEGRGVGCGYCMG